MIRRLNFGLTAQEGQTYYDHLEIIQNAIHDNGRNLWDASFIAIAENGPLPKGRVVTITDPFIPSKVEYATENEVVGARGQFYRFL